MSCVKEEIVIKDEDGENENDEDSDEEDEENEDEPEKEPADVSHYTLEEKIVAAVWVHERVRNHMTWDQMMKNFRHRFRNKPPSKQTLLCWERKLFTTGNAHDKTRSGRPIARLMHVPYVKQSIEESPNLSIRERAKELGLPYATLLKILKEDLKMAYVPDEEAPKKKSTLSSPNIGGKWKFVENNTEATAKKLKPNEKEPVKNEINSNNTNNIQRTSPAPNTNFNSISTGPASSTTPQQASSSYNYGIHPANSTPNQMQSNSSMVSLYQNYTNY